MKKNTQIQATRRQFLGMGAAAAAATVVPRYVLGGPKFVAPSEKVNIAIVGAGGQGRTNARNLFHLEFCKLRLTVVWQRHGRSSFHSP
jgi:hypothetical protein